MHQNYHYKYLVLAYLLVVSIQTFIVNVFDHYSITLLMTLGIILLIALSGYIFFFRLEKLYVEENEIIRQNLILNKSKRIPFDNIRFYSKQKRKLKDGKEITEFILYLNHCILTIDKYVPNCGDVIRFLKSKKRSFSLYSRLHIELDEGLKTLGYITFTLSFIALLGLFHGEQTETFFTTLAFLNLISIATLLLGPQPFQKDLLENYEK